MERLIKDYEQLANKYTQMEMLLEKKLKESEGLQYDNEKLRKELKDRRDIRTLEDDFNRLKELFKVYGMINS
jgi:hypothetical protein